MLKIDIKPSRQLIALMWIILFFSEILLLFWPSYFVLRGMIGVTVFLYWYRIYQKYALLNHANSLVRLERSGDEDWKVVVRSGEFFGKILGSSTLTTTLCVLRFEKVGGGKYETLIFVDSVGKDKFRELVVSTRN